MPLIITDRVLESSTTTGTGVFTLAGASLGFRSFASVCSVADTVWYYIEGVNSFGQPTGEYEYGLGTYSGVNQLTRTTVRGSSNGGSAVNFTAGTKLVGTSPLAPSTDPVRAEWRSALNAAAAGVNADITSLTGLGTAELNIGSGQLVKSVTGNLQVGTETNVDARRLLVNGPGSGGVYASIIDPTQTLNEVLMGMEPSASRAVFQSSLFPLYLNVNGDRMKIDASGEFSSWCVDALRPMFHTRAWCSFVGSGTPAMRGSGNFSSTITDHGPGEFTLAFTTAMPDANYAVQGTVSNNTTNSPCLSITSQAAGSFRIKVTDSSGNLIDPSIVNLVVVR